MKCPTCTENTPDDWKRLMVKLGPTVPQYDLKAPQAHAQLVSLDWMHCANQKCGELVIRIHERYATPAAGGEVSVHTSSWIVRPRASTRPVDPLVPDDLRRDYGEAAAILDISPRMSAVLSRKILADLLRQYAGLTQYSLTEQIAAFRADTKHPSHVRKPLHYLREIGDFSAHTQTSEQAEIIEVGREEAEWTLDAIDRLFDYFIVSPAEDRGLYESMDEKLKEAGRKSIKPLPDEEA